MSGWGKSPFSHWDKARGWLEKRAEVNSEMEQSDENDKGCQEKRR